MPTKMFLAALLLLIGLGHAAAAEQALSAAGTGHDLAAQRCGGCHAVDRGDSSALPAAPPFRTLGQRYPLETLEEALAEGIFAGHPEMPGDPWEPADIQSLISYLETIQTR
ncbi:cytochrome c [Emcibacter sp. SYSU 3D8]|uniref:cytochrome c n=1 Tax=Emcibacter sp. SYSU 3D8 TaxID=3133969 RepID=UPI0031FE57B8